MANYARSLRRASRAEVARLKSEGAASSASSRHARARRWLHRDDDKIPHAVRAQVAEAVAQSPYLAKLVAMREEEWSALAVAHALDALTGVFRRAAVADLQAWLQQGRGERHRRACRSSRSSLRAVHA
jgi:stearoyl-CoA desaturase (delta-9 desaturase)